METYESIVRIKHGATILVEIGDPMWTPVAINGQQVVQAIGRVRAAGGDTEPRGNETNVLVYEKCVETSSIEAALKAELNHAVGLPRTKATVLLEFSDDSGFTLANATVENWNGGQTERLARLGTTIRGGQLTVTV